MSQAALGPCLFCLSLILSPVNVCLSRNCCMRGMRAITSIGMMLSIAFDLHIYTVRMLRGASTYVATQLYHEGQPQG